MRYSYSSNKKPPDRQKNEWKSLLVWIRSMPKQVYLLIPIVCVCLVFLIHSSNSWGFQKTSIGTCKFSGQQAGVKLFLWKSTTSKSSGLKITAPSKFMSLFNSEISWAGIEALKPTCQSFDIMAYTDQVQNGIGKVTYGLKSLEIL